MRKTWKEDNGTTNFWQCISDDTTDFDRSLPLPIKLTTNRGVYAPVNGAFEIIRWYTKATMIKTINAEILVTNHFTRVYDV